MIKLFVGGFPLDTMELELVQLVSPYCEVSTIKIVRDKKTGICKGYAFIEVTDKAGADMVIDELDGTTYHGRELTINITVEKPVAPKPSYARVERRFTPSGGTNSSNTHNDEVRKKRPRKF